MAKKKSKIFKAKIITCAICNFDIDGKKERFCCLLDMEIGGKILSETYYHTSCFISREEKLRQKVIENVTEQMNQTAVNLLTQLGLGKGRIPL